jgi:hypothetical protein
MITLPTGAGSEKQPDRTPSVAREQRDSVTGARIRSLGRQDVTRIRDAGAKLDSILSQSLLHRADVLRMTSFDCAQDVYPREIEAGEHPVVDDLRHVRSGVGDHSRQMRKSTGSVADGASNR